MSEVRADKHQPSSILHLPSYSMSEISDSIQAKCLAFGDRIIKLNDYLLEQAANKKPGYKMVNGKRVYNKAVPVYLQAVSNLCNQLLRSGTSIGANNAEATNAVSKTDYRAKSYIALKEARESLYWIELLHRNNYIDDKQYQSIYADCEELVKILVARCKKLDEQLKEEKK
jgi:four helix bundle protein